MGAAMVCFCWLDYFGPVFQQEVVCDMVCFFLEFFIEERSAERS